MQEGITSAALALPEAPLYVVVAIFVAITAMVAADIRDEGRRLPKGGVNTVALILLAGSWITVSHIIFAMLDINDFRELSNGAVIGMFAHSIALVLLLVVVSVWYWAVAIYKETPAGMPANPAADS